MSLRNIGGVLGYVEALKILFLIIIFSYSTTKTTVFIMFVLISIMAGINTVLFLELYKNKKTTLVKAETPKSGLSLLIAIFGIGCSSCGTLLVGPILTFVGLGWLVAILPFGGIEFLFLSFILLLLSTYSLLKKLSSPDVCKI